MKIVILNESFFTDKHTKELQKLGALEIYENTDSEEKAIARLKNANIAISDCYIAPLNKKVFENCPNLKFLSINSTGFDLVDIESAKKNGIAISNVPGFSTEAVAEHAIALMLAVCKKIPQLDIKIRKSLFQIDPSVGDQKKYVGTNLQGKTLGIVGLGSIGARTAEIGLGFGMKVLGYNRSRKNIASVKQVALEELLKESDIISLHLPLSEKTENIISENKLKLLKPTAIVINTARNKLIDENAFYELLKSKKIAGAGLDVISNWSARNPLLELENVVFTPHSAWFTQESMENCADIILENVRSFVGGKAINIVN